jgi:folate-binding protein YgfZ
MLTELSVLRIAGADALPFLQGQLSNDVAHLPSGGTQLNALNTPQGRVVAILRLALRPEGLIAILPASLIAPVIERLKRYVLRSKVALTDQSGHLEVAGLLGPINFPDAGPASPDVSVHALSGPSARHLLVGPTGSLAKMAANIGCEPVACAHWRLAGVACGEPQVYPPTSDLFVAQMLNLDLVDGVSFTKGCYTGQEIIARTQHRGRIKRRMLRYRVHQPVALTPGDTVTVDRHTARVVEFAAYDATDGEMLAVVTLGEATRADQNGPLPTVSAERMPLPYSIPDLD